MLLQKERIGPPILVTSVRRCRWVQKQLAMSSRNLAFRELRGITRELASKAGMFPSAALACRIAIIRLLFRGQGYEINVYQCVSKPGGPVSLLSLGAIGNYCKRNAYGRARAEVLRQQMWP